MRNLGPQPDLPEWHTFAVRDLGKGDTCRLDTFMLKNRSSRYPMIVQNLSVDGDGFGVKSPVPGTLIPPNESVPIVLRFCTDQPGTYTGRLHLSLSTGECLLDTSVVLNGSVILSLPDLRLEGMDTAQSIAIFFGSVPVGVSSPPRDIVLHNYGAGTAKGIRYQFQSGGGEFNITPEISVPFDLPADSIRTLSIRAVPADTGLRSGLLLITTDDGWSRQVTLSVNGVKPGVVPDTLYLDFGAVRKGSSAYRDLRILNKGTLADIVTGLEIQDSIDFFFVNSTPSLAAELRPGDAMTATLRFTPQNEGAGNDVLRIRTSVNPATVIPVVLVGRSLYEKAEVDVARVDLDCEAATETFAVRNTGTWPLTVERLELGGRDPGRFLLPDQPGPDQIQPGESKIYRVEYVPGASEARATATVHHSAGQIVFDLVGAPCKDEQPLLTLSLPELEGTVGSVVNLPLQFITDGPIPQDFPFRLRLTYEWSLLVPESEVVGQKVAGDEIADGVKIDEKNPGELTIEGIVRAGTLSGTLLEIPMRVLLGRTYRTDLTLSELPPNGLPAGYRVLFDPGTFLALDCDTSGTIDISGRYGIKQNTPNPFSAKTTIRFEIARREHVRIVLYNAAGTIIATLLDQTLDKGEHEISIEPGRFAAGLYFYEITSGRFKAAKSMLIVE